MNSNNTGRSRRSRNTYTTRSGKNIKVNQTLSDRRQARKSARAADKALYLSTLPKGRFKRLLYRLEPKHLYHYWFSREGAIMALKVVGVALVVCFFMTIGLFAYFRKDLPQLKDIAGDNLGGSVSYYDRTGTTLLWQDYNAVKRVPVQSNQISPYMKEATVSIEDRNFYKEGAFDIRGIMRAATHDVFSGGALEGGSTITQQLVKLNEGWTDNRTITRKIKELILAVEVEREYTKDQILTGYLNIAPYSGIDYGVQAASEDYFHVNASQLTLPEATMLAAIPQSPSYYSPYGSTQWNPDAGDTFSATALKTRQDYILNEMVKQHYITQTQANAAMKVNVLALIHPQQGKYQDIQDPYFVLAAKQQLQGQFGTSFVDRGGLKVITTLNTQLQNDANQDVASNAKAVAAVGGDEEAMVAENVKTGQVVAQVGGENFNDPTDGQIDYAGTNISPGSSMKPFMYAALIQNNTDVGAGSVLYDSQSAIPGYPCTNKAEPTATSSGGNCLWDDNFTYPGPETIRYALAGSRNVPAVKASYLVDPTDNGSDGYAKSENEWINMANNAIGTKNAYACYQQGVNVETATSAQMAQCYGSSALGSGDIQLDKEVNGDATFARLGQEIPQTYILSVTDASGKSVYQWKQPKGKQVYKADTAYIINSMLDDPRATYLQPYQKFQNYDGWDIAVKTGTENQEYNGVMTAWSTQYAVIGFAGYHTLNKPLEEGHFEDITEPITKTWMEQALTALHMKPVNWTQPSNIKSLPSFQETISPGYGAEMPSPKDDLYPSWYTGKNSGTSSETIDKVSGYLATSCTPTLARETLTNGNDASYSIDAFYPKDVGSEQALEGGPKSSSTTQTDNVHSCTDSPPSITLTAPSTCNTSCTITATVTQGTHPLSDPQYPKYPGTVTFKLGGQTIKTFTVSQSPSTVSFTYVPPSSGSGTLTASVTDSVLYEGTASQAMSYTGSSATALTMNSAVISGASVDFNWSGGSPSYSVYLSSNPQTPISGCDSVSSTSCQTTAPITAGTQVFVEDSTGSKSYGTVGG